MFLAKNEHLNAPQAAPLLLLLLLPDDSKSVPELRLHDHIDELEDRTHRRHTHPERLLTHTHTHTRVVGKSTE